MKNFIYKNSFITIGLLLFFVSCGSLWNQYQGLKLKIYYSRPDLGGIVRMQENEFRPYEDTKGFLCVSQPDFDALLNLCFGGSAPQSFSHIMKKEMAAFNKFGETYQIKEQL